MNCKQVRALLVAYLDGEVTPSERALVQAHLSGCTVCRQELTLLSTARGRVRSVLQHRAAHAVPARDAWSRLEKSLTEADRPSSRSAARIPRLAPDAGRASIRRFLGGLTMRKRLIASAVVVVAALSIFIILTARSVTPVSAKEILARASRTQSIKVPAEGIEHLRYETYSNFQALTEDQGMTTTVDSYLDFKSGNFRTVTTDVKTGKVLDAIAYDGTYTYSQDREAGPGTGDLLTIFRTPQKLNLADQPRGEMNWKDTFDEMQKDPNVKLVGRETWADGRTVYVLRSQGPVKLLAKDYAQLPTGLRTIYFDVKTYQTVGSQETMEQNGKEVLIYSDRQLVNEILPAGSSVAWGLGDVQGITVVDDPNREHGDLLPEPITPQELAAKTKSAYLLKTVPDGFSLEITAPPIQPADLPYTYVASYRSKADDLFVIQDTGSTGLELLPDQEIEKYTTAGGLVLHITEDETDLSGRQDISVIVETPDKTTFLIDSTLPRATVKAWAEDLVLVK